MLILFIMQYCNIRQPNKILKMIVDLGMCHWENMSDAMDTASVLMINLFKLLLFFVNNKTKLRKYEAA